MTYQDKRITKLRAYLIGVLNSLTQNTKYELNANNLASDVNNYSLDKIPMQKEINKWIIGTFIIIFGMILGLVALIIINKKVIR